MHAVHSELIEDAYIHSYQKYQCMALGDVWNLYYNYVNRLSESVYYGTVPFKAVKLYKQLIWVVIW